MLDSFVNVSDPARAEGNKRILDEFPKFKDRDKVLSADEFAAGYPDRPAEGYLKMDADGDGSVDHDEYEAGIDGVLSGD